MVLAAGLVLVSMLLPWYSKSTNAITKSGLANAHESKLAILVPSFIEASIFLVSLAVLALMFFRGERRAFHLPFGDGIVVSAAGAWVGFLVFYRFIDQPAGGKTKTLVYSYDLSWGIFFGLIAAAFLVYAGTRLRLAQVCRAAAARRGADGSCRAGGHRSESAATGPAGSRRWRDAAELRRAGVGTASRHADPSSEVERPVVLVACRRRGTAAPWRGTGCAMPIADDRWSRKMWPISARTKPNAISA